MTFKKSSGKGYQSTTVITVFAFIAGFSLIGCEHSTVRVPIAATCENVVVAKDSFSVQVLEYLPLDRSIVMKKAISPKDRVIMSAIFHCKSGQLLYGTWKKMSASSKAELHFVDAVGDAVIDMDSGLNSIIALQGGEVLAETAAVKQGNLDKTSGDLSAQERVREPLPPGPSRQHPQGGPPVHGQTYIEDIIFNASTRKELRRIPVSLGRREFRSGKLISYSMDQTIYEINPLTGQNTQLQDYRPSYSYGAPIAQLPAPNYKFPVGGKLYAVAGAKQEPHTTGYLAANRIYRYNGKDRNWVEASQLSFEPKWAAADDSQLIAIGESGIAVYETKTGSLRSTAFEFGAYRPTSFARLGTVWALSVAPKENGKSASDDIPQIWILSEDFSGVLLRHPMPGFGPLKLTSEATSTPVHAW